jgi:acyl dehydratase
MTTAPMRGVAGRLERLGDGVRADQARVDERNVAALAVDHVPFHVDHGDAALRTKALGGLLGARFFA